MNEFVYKITLDLNCSKTPPVIYSGQFDKGRKFEFTVTANGEPYDVTGCSAVLKGVRTNGSHFAVECTVSNGKVVKILDDTTLSVRGMTVAKLVISNSTKSYSTQKFVIDVDSSLDGNITVADDYSILNRLIEQIHALNESGAILIDDTIDKNSNNAVANRAVAIALDGKLDNASGSVKTDNIASKAVTSDKIANGAITALKINKGAVSGSNIADNQISTNHLQNGKVTTDKLADEVKTGINSKYDSSNVETGSGSLTPYSTSADIVKSADFTYQRVGRVVTVNVNIVFNAGTKSQVMFTNLPYVCKNTVNPRELCVSNSKVTRIWAINKNNTTLSIFSDSSLSYADEEILAFTQSYLAS